MGARKKAENINFHQYMDCWRDAGVGQRNLKNWCSSQQSIGTKQGAFGRLVSQSRRENESENDIF